MVKNLHAAGIEVILDVVYNHTAEGNQLGPTISFKGIDNASYYRLVGDNPRFYMDYTGTGNTLDATHPHVLQLIMDSLRYWVMEMHVDGFRFDLASTLAREAKRCERILGVFRRDPPGPGVESGQAHRRAVGRGRRRLSGGQFPRALGRVERQVPRRDPPLLEGRRGPHRRTRLPAHGQPGSVSAQRQAARTRASISSPRTTASRSTISSATTKSTTRPTARATTTATTTTPVGTAAPKARPTTRKSTRCAAASGAISWRRCSLPGRADDLRRATNTAARRAATTTPIARTTNSPGWTGSADERATRSLFEFHPQADRPAPRAPDFPSAEVFPGPQDSRRGA